MLQVCIQLIELIAKTNNCEKMNGINMITKKYKHFFILDEKSPLTRLLTFTIMAINKGKITIYTL